MEKIENSDIMKQTIKTLLIIVSRRASSSVSILLMDTLLKALTERYFFLKDIKIRSSLSYGDITNEVVVIDPTINSVDPTTVGKVIETMIRVILMDLKEKAGVFFIKELKEKIGDQYVIALRERQVDLDILQLERDYARTQQQRRVEHHVDTDSKISKKPDEERSVTNYRWDNVAKWKYENNVCFLYDKEGKILDKLYLDQIIENHIREITEPNISEKTKEPIEINEHQIKLMNLLYSRDIDMQEAKYYMQKTQPEIEYMIYELVKIDFLQQDSDDTVKLTSKGIEYLLSEEEKKLKQTKTI